MFKLEYSKLNGPWEHIATFHNQEHAESYRDEEIRIDKVFNELVSYRISELTYLEYKLAQFRELAADDSTTDEQIVEFMQELVGEGYGDGMNAASIQDGLKR